MQVDMEKCRRMGTSSIGASGATPKLAELHKTLMSLELKSCLTAIDLRAQSMRLGYIMLFISHGLSIVPISPGRANGMARAERLLGSVVFQEKLES